MIQDFGCIPRETTPDDKIIGNHQMANVLGVVTIQAENRQYKANMSCSGMVVPLPVRAVPRPKATQARAYPTIDTAGDPFRVSPLQAFGRHLNQQIITGG